MIIVKSIFCENSRTPGGKVKVFAELVGNQTFS